MNIERLAGTPASAPPALEPLDLTNIRLGMSPAVLEMIGQQFFASAARLRAHGHTGAEGRA